jgi:hypothetical protein
MEATPHDIASFSVLRLDASALDDANDIAHEAGGYRALLAAPSGSAASRSVRLSGASTPYDFIVVEYDAASRPFTRAWARHADLADAVAYTFFAETPAAFPARSFPLEALQPRAGVEAGSRR